MKKIVIKGAKLHNLKNIDIEIPKDKIVVITGVSGSGKSTLAFDIIFEEGRKNYLHLLGVVPEIEKYDKFSSISGISPTVAIKQNIIRKKNPRSTVGTKTNILKQLALLYISDGEIKCSFCGTIVDKDLKCKNCGNVEEKLRVGFFSYNHPEGLCIKCSGRGKYYEIDIEKLVPNRETTIDDILKKVDITPGYLKLFRKKFSKYLDIPFFDTPDEIKRELIYGHHVNSNGEKTSYCLMRMFKNSVAKYGKDISDIYKEISCPNCNGYRVGEKTRDVLLNGKHIGELAKLTILELKHFLNNLLDKDISTKYGKKVIKEILKQLNNLIKFSLGYLTLYREIPTLSGGELQRLFLNTHLNSTLDSLIYIFDEPTSGLHEMEKKELLEAILKLKNSGNSVILVEHDKKCIKMGDFIIDIGPKAGVDGGKIVYKGSYTGVVKDQNSLTGKYLSNKLSLPYRESIKKIDNKTKFLTLKKININNVKDINLSIPLNCLVGIAGVSGSGKSSLISGGLVPLLKKHFNNKTVSNRLKGVENLKGYVEISQKPIGRNINSNPATYLGVWDSIRKIFSKQPDSVKNGFNVGYFSFNSKGGCSNCNGTGEEKIYLGTDYTINNICKKCNGKRYKDQVLKIKYKNRDIFEILDMDISEAIRFFKDDKTILSKLKIVDKIGMGYIKLGQPTSTLSGGEAQRLKLAKEITKKRGKNILYIMDEPTSGLSFHDISKLIKLIDQLILKGNSIIVIEHDIDLLSKSDWIIEMGPKSGIYGGKIISQGVIDDIKSDKNSLIGGYLK